MKQLNEHDAELLSALADGRLQGEPLQQALALASDSEAGQLTWHAYHVVGDVLRSTELADCRGDTDFLARLRCRLAEEPQHAAVLPMHADVPAVVVPVGPVPVSAVAQGRGGPVPASNTRWKLVAGLASVAAVATMGWQWIGSPLVPAGLPVAQVAGNTGAGPSVPVAVAPAAAPAAAAVAQSTQDADAQPVMLRDPRLDELLAAHRQFGGTSALQMPAGFLRNATFERPER